MCVDSSLSSGAVRRAQSTRQCPQEVLPHRGRTSEHRLELPTITDLEDHVGGGRDGRAACPAVEERDFAEAVTRAETRDELTRDRHIGMPFDDDDKLVPGGPFDGESIAWVHAATACSPHDLGELGIAATRERTEERQSLGERIA